MTRDRVLLQAGGVLSRRSGDRLVVLGVQGGDVTVLSGTAAVLWQLLSEPTPLGDVASFLAEMYGMPVDVVMNDIGAAVDDLERASLVIATGATP